jgi:hypothetical protein
VVWLIMPGKDEDAQIVICEKGFLLQFVLILFFALTMNNLDMLEPLLIPKSAPILRLFWTIISNNIETCS